jgi:membrane protein YdbS with pleckstrin-like domain
MDRTRVLDSLPVWALFAATVLLVFAAVELGIYLGRYRRRLTEQEKDAPVGAIVGATLGLLAFMLAFTFGLAASRFDARRVVVLDEANAIGTTYLRAGMLPEPNRATCRKLLREYVDVRLQAVQTGELKEVLVESGELHNALWKQAEQAAAADPRSVPTGLFTESLNEVIDLHAKRVLVALHSRVPELVWMALYFIAALAMASLGYHQGLSGSRRSLAVLALALTFSAVIVLIAALDRPQETVIRVSQSAMTDLRDSMKHIDSETAPMKP